MKNETQAFDGDHDHFCNRLRDSAAGDTRNISVTLWRRARRWRDLNGKTLYGASLCGNFLLTWFARNAADSDARQAIILDLLVHDAIGLVATLIFQLSGGMNILGWSIVAIYLFLTLGYGYFYLAKPVST